MLLRYLNVRSVVPLITSPMIVFVNLVQGIGLQVPTPIPIFVPNRNQGGTKQKSAICSNLINADGVKNAADNMSVLPAKAQSPSALAPMQSARQLPLAQWYPSLNVAFWEKYLPLVYPHTQAKGILNSITSGVRIGRQPTDCTIISPNWPSALEFRNEVNDIIQADLEAGKLHGPFTEPPYDRFIVSPLGAFQKRNSSKVRVIHDLSYPSIGSVNSLIDSDEYTLTYASIDDAVNFIVNMDSEAIFLSKMDLKDAFKSVFIDPVDWPLMGFSWMDPAGCTQYYFSKTLNFGLRSAPFLFDSIADPLLQIMFHRGLRPTAIRYVDDFLIMAPSAEDCATSLDLMLSVAREAGFVIQQSKVTSPSRIVEFLGIVIDTCRGELRISQDRLDELKTEVTHWLGQGTLTKRKLLSIIGRCAFASKVIRGGKPFLARLFAAARSAKKLHHKIRLPAEAKRDLEWWAACITAHNGVTLYKPNWLGRVRHIHTDASNQGLGACLDNCEWFFLSYTGSRSWMLQESINWREMHAAVLALHTWAPALSGSSVIFHIDNTTTCYILNSGYTQVDALMFFVRHWYMILECYSITVAPVYISTHENTNADDLSRLRVDSFLDRNPSADRVMTWPDEGFMDSSY